MIFPLHTDWDFDWADSYRKLESVTPVTFKGVQYLNISFTPDAGPPTTPHLQVVKNVRHFCARAPIAPPPPLVTT